MPLSTPCRFDLVDLRLFLHVVEAGSITLGAQRAHLALASASARIRGMEDRLGLALLLRQRSGVQATQAGQAVAHHARLVLQQLERLRAEVGQYLGGLAGTVRLLANTAAITDRLPGPLAAFLLQHPGIDIDLEEQPSHAIVQLLRGGVGDLGILADSADTATLEVQPFARDRLVVVAATGHTLARRRRLRFAQVLDHPLVGLQDDSALQQHLARQAAQLGRQMHTRIRLRSFDAVCHLVAAGVGMAVLPQAAADRAAQQLPLRVLPLDEPWADRQLLLCARRFSDLPAAATALLAVLQQAVDPAAAGPHGTPTPRPKPSA